MTVSACVPNSVDISASCIRERVKTITTNAWLQHRGYTGPATWQWVAVPNDRLTLPQYMFLKVPRPGS